jgi:hypothetical protein
MLRITLAALFGLGLLLAGAPAMAQDEEETTPPVEATPGEPADEEEAPAAPSDEDTEQTEDEETEDPER